MNQSPSLGYNLQQISGLMVRHTDNLLTNKLNLTYSQYKILNCLVDSEQLRQIDIAHYLNQTEASISRQIKLMQNENLVTMMLNQKNHREHLIKITTKGLRKFNNANVLLNNYYQPVFDRLSDNQKLNLLNTLEQLQDYLRN